MGATYPWNTVTAVPHAEKSDALTQHAFSATQGHFGTSANVLFVAGFTFLFALVAVWYVKPLVIDAIARRIARRADRVVREAAGYVVIPTMVDSDRETLPGFAAANLSPVPTVAPVIGVIPSPNSGGRWGRFDLADPGIHPERETYGQHADTNDFRTAQLPQAIAS